MKKSIYLLAMFLAFSVTFANYNQSQAFFDGYNQSTQTHFKTYNNSFQQDAKIVKYSNSYKSKEFDYQYGCKVTIDGELQCGKYKIVEVDPKKDAFEIALKDYYKNKKSSIKIVSRGEDFDCAIDNTDDLYCWGSNERGQLGSKTKKEKSEHPLKVNIDKKFKTIFTKAHYACALDTDNYAYCWGDGSSGEVGNGKKGYFSAPQKVETNVKFSRLSMSETYVCGVSLSKKDIYCWGKGTLGGLKPFDSSTPIKI